MGTNYYLHIGKRSSRGIGKGCTFTEAVQVTQSQGGDVLIVRDGVIVLDEYGHEMTWTEFNDLIRNDKLQRGMIGRAFS